MLIDTSPSTETKHELERSTEEIHRLTAIIDRLNLEMVDLRKDRERLDWLESKTDGSSWVARESATGRGFRLHNTGRDDSHQFDARSTARGAIDAAIAASPSQ